MQKKDTNNDKILELRKIDRYQSKNFVQDVKQGETLDLRDLGKQVDDFNSVFSNELRTTDLIKHKIKLTSMVRQISSTRCLVYLIFVYAHENFETAVQQKVFQLQWIYLL